MTVEPSTRHADQAALIELWNESTSKRPAKRGTFNAGSGRNLSAFAAWAVDEFGEATVQSCMGWTDRDLYRLLSTGFGESTAPRRKGAIPKQGVATEAQHAWNDGRL